MADEFVGPYQIPRLVGDEPVARVSHSTKLAAAINNGISKAEAVALEVQEVIDGPDLARTFAADDNTPWRWFIVYETGEVALGQRSDGSWYPGSFGGGGEVTTDTPVIIRGDSLTAAWAGHTSSLASTLGRPVSAQGNGSRESYWIAARQGGEPLRVSVAGGAIPGSGPVDVDLSYRPLVGSTGANNVPVTAGSYAGVLSGVAGVLAITGAGVGTFTRATSGWAVPLPDGSLFTTGLDTRAHWHIIWAGRNNFGQANDGEQITNDIRAMLDWATDKEHALVLSIPPWATETHGTSIRDTLEAVNGQLRDMFPGQFVDTSAMLRSEATLSAVGITPTATDVSNIADGVTPESFRSDNGHLNTKGYEALNLIITDIYNARGWN